MINACTKSANLEQTLKIFSFLTFSSVGLPKILVAKLIWHSEDKAVAVKKHLGAIEQDIDSGGKGQF